MVYTATGALRVRDHPDWVHGDNRAVCLPG